MAGSGRGLILKYYLGMRRETEQNHINLGQESQAVG
jgi:hypothetical protein